MFCFCLKDGCPADFIGARPRSDSGKVIVDLKVVVLLPRIRPSLTYVVCALGLPVYLLLSDRKAVQGLFFFFLFLTLASVLPCDGCLERTCTGSCHTCAFGTRLHVALPGRQCAHPRGVGPVTMSTLYNPVDVFVCFCGCLNLWISGSLAVFSVFSVFPVSSVLTRDSVFAHSNEVCGICNF